MVAGLVRVARGAQDLLGVLLEDLLDDLLEDLDPALDQVAC
jgi:hypothetical protein